MISERDSRARKTDWPRALRPVETIRRAVNKEVQTLTKGSRSSGECAIPKGHVVEVRLFVRLSICVNEPIEGVRRDQRYCSPEIRGVQALLAPGDVFTISVADAIEYNIGRAGQIHPVGSIIGSHN